MLTITETIDAIRKIDTDPDVIFGACRQIANPNTSKTTLSREELITEIVEAYSSRAEPSKIIQAMITATAIIITMSTKDGGETTVIEGTTELFTRVLRSAFSVVQMSKTLHDIDPEAFTKLAAIIRKI